MSNQMRALPKGREAFALGLAEGLDQAKAFRRAYPASLKWKEASVWQKASRLAKDAKVQARVVELRAEVGKQSAISLERIASELARLSLVDVRNVVKEDGTPKKLHELDEDTARAIIGIDVVSVGNSALGEGQVLKFKLADKGANLERLAKLLGFFEKDNRQKNPMGQFDAARFFGELFRKPDAGD